MVRVSGRLSTSRSRIVSVRIIIDMQFKFPFLLAFSALYNLSSKAHHLVTIVFVALIVITVLMVVGRVGFVLFRKKPWLNYSTLFKSVDDDKLTLLE